MTGLSKIPKASKWPNGQVNTFMDEWWTLHPATYQARLKPSGSNELLMVDHLKGTQPGLFRKILDSLSRRGFNWATNFLEQAGY